MEAEKNDLGQHFQDYIDQQRVQALNNSLLECVDSFGGARCMTNGAITGSLTSPNQNRDNSSKEVSQQHQRFISTLSGPGQDQPHNME